MVFFFFNDTATTEIYTLSLHDALPIYGEAAHHCQRRHEVHRRHGVGAPDGDDDPRRSEEHTSELQSPCNLVCRLLLEKKKKTHIARHTQKYIHKHTVQYVQVMVHAHTH